MAIRQTGFSLVEVVVSLGVLAVVIPLVLASLAAGAHSDAAARMDSLVPAVTQVCVDELGAVRKGEGRWLTETRGPHPQEDEVWAIGFSATGQPVGRVEAGAYHAGSPNQEMMCLARMENDAPDEAAAELGQIRLTVEFPAAAKQEKRQRLELYTRLP